MSPPLWPSLNASLNALTAVLLVAGAMCIQRRRIQVHRLCMSTAFAVSCAFLVSYLLYHARVGSVRFQGTGWVRPVYFAILLSHTVLAVVIVPLALRTFYLALRARWEAHRRLARWTLPLWLYVSVTGVVVYGLLYSARYRVRRGQVGAQCPRPRIQPVPCVPGTEPVVAPPTEIPYAS